MKKVVKIGTRKSPLALKQTDLFVEALKEKYPDIKVEIVTIITSGDKLQNISLANVGGKGLFTKEIEEGLLSGELDFAVHSMKDMPTVLPEGLEINCMLKREDARDAFLSTKAKTIYDLPKGAVFGTASARRKALVKNLRPDLEVKLLRGNIETRIQKMQNGEVDATMLAVAGLVRADKMHVAQSVFEIDEILPAVGQGAIGIEVASSNKEALDMAASINCSETYFRVSVERAFLNKLDGSCKTPIAGYMSEKNNKGEYNFKALIARPDGSELVKREIIIDGADLDKVMQKAEQLALEVKNKLPDGFLV